MAVEFATLCAIRVAKALETASRVPWIEGRMRTRLKKRRVRRVQIACMNNSQSVLVPCFHSVSSDCLSAVV
jgi:O6-methylguanine-DNA--protein-cysteine methyltransferase